MKAYFHRRAFVIFLVVIRCLSAAPPPPPNSIPHFTESSSDRRQRIENVRAEIDRLFNEFAVERHLPGFAYGIVLDGELVLSGAGGLANVEKNIPAAPVTRFRIASMTKSFTALAVLKLRDAGKLALSDPVEKFLPEFRHVAPLTTDAEPITLRHLLTMTAGFPEDNPWGDRQLAVSVDDLRAFVRGGASLSNAPGVAYEYSNFGFALLGQIITTVAREPYQRFITREILAPLGMKNTRWEFGDVPADQLALGYRWEKNAWRPEPMLHDGTYGAMGGLLTTIDDFARYVSFHLSAWPPRDDPESSIARRATLREMHQPAIIATLVSDPQRIVGDAVPVVAGYCYGLRWAMDGHNVINVGHSGGLPGFGSNYRFYPDRGLGIISFANLTYAGMSTINARVGALLIEKAGLPPRKLPVSAILETRQRQIAELLPSWDAQLAASIVAENFFLDHTREDWIERSRDILARAGKITSVGELAPENQLRGTFPLVGEHGRIDVFFTLTPERIPRLQELRLTFIANP